MKKLTTRQWGVWIALSAIVLIAFAIGGGPTGIVPSLILVGLMNLLARSIIPPNPPCSPWFSREYLDEKPRMDDCEKNSQES